MLQGTRLERGLRDGPEVFSRWARHPWRRVSLLVLTFLVAFFLGNTITSVAGALSLLDPLVAVVAVAFSELLVRQRTRLRQQRGEQQIWLHLLDMLRMGFLYGLVLDGLRFIS